MIERSFLYLHSKIVEVLTVAYFASVVFLIIKYLYIMNLIIKRKYFCKDYIIGDVYLETGNTFVCHSLEPSLTAAHPAIPGGTYPITFAFSQKFNRYMPYVDNVKGRVGIMIHTGNSPKDTKGCILLGMNTIKGGLTDSKNCFNPIRALLIQSIVDSNENCFLIIKNI